MCRYCHVGNAEETPGDDSSNLDAIEVLLLDPGQNPRQCALYSCSSEKSEEFGFLGAARIQRALTRILARVKQQHFNSIEVTGIVARRFLGVPYVTVSAHSRHMQQSCDLNSPESRQTSEDSATWARG